MPLYTVPKFLEVEMKVAGPFTFKQFLIILAIIFGVAFTFMYLPRPLFFLVLIALFGVLIAFNTIKVEGTRIYEVFLEGIAFFLSPKILVWQKDKTKRIAPFEEIIFEMNKSKKGLKFKKGGNLEKMKLNIQIK